VCLDGDDVRMLEFEQDGAAFLYPADYVSRTPYSEAQDPPRGQLKPDGSVVVRKAVACKR
jgi:hypothetical protein